MYTISSGRAKWCTEGFYLKCVTHALFTNIKNTTMLKKMIYPTPYFILLIHCLTPMLELYNIK